jgi:hypothetical protein
MSPRHFRNIYLHYVFGLWAERWHKRHCLGRVIIVRFADDSLSVSSMKVKQALFADQD